MDPFPCELWEEIARHLPAYDLMNLCKASLDLCYLLRDKRVVINFDLSGCYDFHKENLYLCMFSRVEFNHVKFLNINKLYWIDLDELRCVVQLLPQLEELRALDTKLGMRNEDLILYKKLRKLAVSVEADQFTSSRETYKENLVNLKSLCIKFISKYKADFRRIYYMFFNELRGLDELWLYDADDYEKSPLRYDYIVCNLRNLKKFIIKSKANVPFLDYKPFGMLKIFERKRSYITIICYVRTSAPQIISLRKRSLSEVFESRTEKSWDIVRTFLCQNPCNYRNSLEISEKRSFKHVEFQELSFLHVRTCNPTFVNAAIDILLSKHCKGLKKVALTLCILQEGNIEKSEKKNIFRHIINNSPYMTDLEIATCNNSEYNDPEADSLRIPCSAILGAYELISNLRYLKKLTLEIPTYSSGAFLKDVFLKCPQLESLRLLSRENNEDLNSVLYSHLNYAQMLRDFRFENVHIDLDRLFSALNKNLTSKLSRIVTKCEYEHSSQLWPVEKLLKRHANVILLVICVSKYNRHQVTKLQELMDEHKDHPAKIYVACTDIKEEEGYFFPEAHKDILSCNSNISMLSFMEY
ncbi:uncharacterized protein LOC115877513 isoform X2 [Sitophilus oryzae]|uniref:Uncharacterized protein LOC115877513 isoform X2 n=1 Tax=Sitophilus oryzae TaxID=7048 RepID=A0A6J2XF59_SITOR|nr:uncharacterized protein LOC115877513 isoform X2 [Sitophilus oryzae]